MVTKTATVSLFGNDYEVDPALAGRRCELLFDPFDLTSIEVRHAQRPFGLARPVRIGRHTHPKATALVEPPAQGTGIDYLGLLAAQRDDELRGRRIDYRDLTSRGEHNDGGDREGGR